MTKPNRDLLILNKQFSYASFDRDREENLLHTILQKIEKFENFARAHEVINIHRNKIFRNTADIKLFLVAVPVKPFVFLNNCN